MANYITRPAIDRKAGKTDIEQLMPYLQNELTTVRNNDNAKIATLQEIERNALADPEGFRGTNFHIDNSGFLNMNEKAKNLARLEGEEGYDQTALSNSETVLDTELTDKVNQANFDRINNTAERNAARAENAELGSIDKTKLAELAMNQQNAQGQNIIGDKGIANTTPPATQQTEGSIATSTKQPAAEVDPNFTGPTLTAEQIAANNPTPPDPLKTGNAAEKANALAQANPGMGAAAKEGNTKSESSGEKANYTIKTDMGVGKSTFENDMIKTKTTEARAGIIDQDKTTLKSLKRAAGIERLGNMAMAGRPGATQANTMATRLAAREAFLTDIQGKYGVTARTKEQSGGNSKFELGNINAGFTATSGASSQTSNIIKNDNSARLTSPAAGDPNAKPVQGAVGLSDGTTLQANDTGKRVGNSPIVEYKTPAGFKGGTGSTKIGQLLQQDPQKMKKWVETVWGGQHSWDKGTNTHTVRKGEEYITLYPDGSFSSNLTQGSANTILGLNDLSGMGANGQDASATANAELEQSPNGVKTTVKGKKR